MITVIPAVFTPDFEADLTTGPAALSVQFQDTTSGAAPTAWLWDFGDQLSSTAQHPLHTFVNPGTYSVTLTSFVGKQMASLTKTNLIVVDPATLQPAFTATPTSGVNPLPVAFTDTSSGASPTAWYWQFGDGDESSLASPLHRYTAPGTYTVSLTTFLGEDNLTTTQQGLIEVAPAMIAVDFSAAPVSGDAPLTTDFFNETVGAQPTGWHWDFGDGFSSRETKARHTYLLPGLYPVTLTALVAEQTISLIQDALIAVGPFDGLFSQVGDLVLTPLASPSNFSSQLTADNGLVVLGDRLDDILANNAGTAVVFERRPDGTWTETDRLYASDGATSDGFGSGVSLDGDRVVVGAPGANVPGNDGGAAYVFERNGAGAWLETAKLTARTPASGDNFGNVVSVSGERIAVGANRDDEAGTDVGAVYVYDRTASGTWGEVAQLLPSIAEPGQRFGWSLVAQGNTVVAGVLLDPSGLGTGLAFVFQRQPSGNWIETAVLMPSDPQANNQFGRSLALDGDTILVGSANTKVSQPLQGAVYVFDRQVDGTWLESDRLVPAGTPEEGQFGLTVALRNGRAAIGSPRTDPFAPHGKNHGEVTILDRQPDGTWSELATLYASDGQSSLGFGRTLALGEQAIVVESIRLIPGATAQGQGRLFFFEEGVATEQDLPTSPPTANTGLRWATTTGDDQVPQVRLRGADPHGLIVLKFAESTAALADNAETTTQLMTADAAGTLWLSWPVASARTPAIFLRALTWRDGSLVMSPILSLNETGAAQN